MSRVGKKLITLPAQVQLSYDNKANVVTAKGGLGELTQTLNSCISLQINGSEVNVLVKDENEKFQRAIWGTSRAIVQNMVTGVSTGFKRVLELNGVGFKMELAGSKLTLFIGFSHPVIVDVPAAVKLTLAKNVLSGESIDNQLIGNFFSTVHNMKKCDVYKQKGFKFTGRFYRKKVVKKSK